MFDTLDATANRQHFVIIPIPFEARRA
jgi:hypothetical protein